MIPTIGRIVLYQTDGRNGYRYALPAIIVRTQASTDRAAVSDGKVKALPEESMVDLMVFSVDGESYGESAVPFCENVGNDGHGAPRSWRWPPRV